MVCNKHVVWGQKPEWDNEKNKVINVYYIWCTTCGWIIESDDYSQLVKDWMSAAQDYKDEQTFLKTKGCNESKYYNQEDEEPERLNEGEYSKELD